MLIDEIVIELLLRLEEKPSLTPEELCQDYKDSPEYPALLAAVKQGIRDLQAAASFLDTSQEDDSESQPPRSPAPPPQPGASGAAKALHIRCPHCNNPIQLLDERSDEVLCPGCGSSFRIRDARQTTTTGAMRPLGKFQLLERVGLGAFGAVWRARDTELDRIVALKIPHTGLLSSAAELERFHREARAAAQLRHPGLVTVHEVQTLEGLPTLVEDFVEGVPLKDLMEVRRLTCREAARLIADVAEALDYAHERGLVHRDLKPANIMLEHDRPKAPTADTPADGPGGELQRVGRPLIMDFGLALRDETEITMTLDGQIIGTPAYMSPEQAAGKGHRADRRSDVYSLGVILYELLTGTLPFRGSRRMMLNQVLHEEPRPPRKLNGEVPRDLETICLKCLQKAPARRYASAKALADDLRRFLNGETILARRTPIWERAVKWARRRPTQASMAGVAVLLLLSAAAAGLLYWDRYLRVQVEYYATVTKRWDAFEGVSRVTDEEARHRSSTYKFYRRGRVGPVEKVEIVNGHGELNPKFGMSTFIDGWTGRLDLTTKRECRYEFKRDQQGRVIDEIASDRNGQIVWILHHTANKDLAYYTDEGGWPTPHAPSGAAYVKFIQNEEGLVKEARYLNKDGNPRPNRDGIFGVQMEYDRRGLPVRQTLLDVRGRPTLNKYHFAEVAVAYNDRGEMTETRFFGLHNEPVIHKDGYAGATGVYDNYGNISALTYVGLDDRPTLHKNGFAKITSDHDDHGNIIRVHLFDTDDKPTLHKNGYAELARQYDERGWLIEERYIGLDSKLTLTKNGYAKATFHHDHRGNVIRKRLFDTDDKPALLKDGNAEIAQQYDERGRLIEESYIGPDGKPTLHKNGFSKAVVKYDDRNNKIEQAYFDVKGKPALHKDGNWMVKCKYDDRNNKIEQAYFDVKGEPTLHKDGNWKVTWKYDDNGNQTEAAYFGLDGRPTFMKNGYSKVTWKHDELGNKTEERYFDPNGRLTLVKGGYAKVKMQYDDRGNKIEQAYFDVQDKPILHKDGYWKLAWKYDDNGHKTEAVYFGLDDRPTLVDGVAKIKWNYDAQGNEIEAAHFGLKDEPVRSRGGHWKKVWEYDNRGNQTEEAYFHPDGKPMRLAKVKQKYDAQGNKIEQALFDPDDKPARHRTEHWSKMVWGYDNRGNQTVKKYLDPDGNLMLVHGVATVRMKYDTQGNKTEIANFGLNDEPVRFNGTYWKRIASYDNRGNQTEEATFGPDDKPMLVDGVAKMKARYDNLGNQVEATFYGLQDKPVLIKFGLAITTSRYDPRGNLIEMAFFDEKGQPTLGRFGKVNMFARVVYRYDDRGNQIEASWYGADGKLTLLGDAAKKKMKYDPRGNIIEQTWFGPDDRPKKSFSGFATGKYIYDDVRGSKLEEAYYDPDGKPTLKVVDVVTVDGSMMIRKAGYAKVKWTYDDRNEIDGATYFDVQGNQLKTQVYITKVSPNSPAKKIGLLPNDLLVNYGGQEIHTRYTLMSIKRSEGPGDKPKDLTVLRDGKLRVFRSTPPGLPGVELEDKVVPDKNEPANIPAKKP